MNWSDLVSRVITIAEGAGAETMHKEFKKTKVSQQDKDALRAMDLNEEVKWEQIHTKFKELVKKYHPDKNQGNKKFEDKLKKITLAYSQLKKTLGKK